MRVNEKNILNILLSKEFWLLSLIFAYRELKIKFAQTRLHYFWVILPPIMGFVITTFFFGRLFKISKDIEYYNIYAYLGMMTWYYISYLFLYSSTSLIQNQDIIQKSNVYRLVFPMAKVFMGLIDLFCWIFGAFVISFIYGIKINFGIFTLVYTIPLHIITGLTFGLIILLFSVKYRDIYQIVPYIISIIMIVTPIFYHPYMIPEYLRIFLHLNPIAGVIELYRSAFLDGTYPIKNFTLSFIILILLFIVVLLIFHKKEKQIAEYV
ncbi:MAG: ABC transporter permease [Bacteroidales bacterium]|nr:ABC transporter permease [Bacteroidales bacterium]